eukprot:Nitzschia sp. Nitz4//scaffold223_size33660//29501//30580//NITZ4_007875-RA/size33660-processed-gene-0.12-mRNA-1//1//CDS//3329542631//5941//frame0
MFRKLFGREGKIKGKKKRVSPKAETGTAQGLPGPEAGNDNSSLGYRYALNEFALTVAPATSNEDGLSMLRDGNQDSPQGLAYNDSNDTAATATTSNVHPHELRARSPLAQNQPLDPSGAVSPSASTINSPTAARVTRFDDEVVTIGSPYSPTNFPRKPGQLPLHAYRMRQSFPESTVADLTYEEWYGDAYLGGPIKYIYPSGYQSMRPRCGPWRLSILIFLLFAWLSVFVIGHCSDQVDQSLYDQENIDDDTYVIETRWCGSKLLYMMWVVSMLITGLSTAYCGVIGYIQVRDFAVANTRSQAPGLAGKSDYYVELRDGNHSPPDDSHYRQIYQADGTPQFWGNQIYRPTQAAVAVTSR